MRPTALKLARIKAGLRQNEVSIATGIAITTLSRLENGKTRPSLMALQKLSKILDTPLEQLAQDYPIKKEL